jgi:hypothetical protein
VERGSGSAVFDVAVHPLICHSRDKKWAYRKVALKEKKPPTLAGGGRWKTSGLAYIAIR